MKKLIFAALLVSSQALAQQPDPALLQKAIVVLQQQRNQAMDAVVGTEARLAIVTEENTKLKAELEKLKKEDKNAK